MAAFRWAPGYPRPVTDPAPPSPEARARWQWTAVACLYLGYVAIMVVKTAVAVAAPVMVDDPTLVGFDTSTSGQVFAWGSVGAVVGKCTNGAVADRLGGRRTFLLALVGSLLAAAAMSGVTGVTAFAALYTLSAFLKSAGWPSMAVIIQNWFVPWRYGSAWGVLSTSARLGSMVSFLLLGQLVGDLGWKKLFLVAGGVVALALVGTWFLMRECPADVGLEPIRDYTARLRAAGEAPEEAGGGTAEEDHPLFGTTIPQALRVFATSLPVWLICTSVGFLTIEMQAFTDFLPLFLNKAVGMSPETAGTISSAFPAGCFVGVLAGGPLIDRLGPYGTRNGIAGLLVASVACVGALALLPASGLAGGRLAAVTGALLVVYGVTISPAYYIPMGIFSIRFGGPHCGILIGIVDAVGYFFAAGFQAVAGNVAEAHGWNAFLALLGGAALASVALMGWFLHDEARRIEAEAA